MMRVDVPHPGGVITRGTKLFDLCADENLSMTVMSTVITSYDLTPFDVVVEDDFVVVFRMTANLSFPSSQAP